MIVQLLKTRGDCIEVRGEALDVAVPGAVDQDEIDRRPGERLQALAVG